MKDFKIFKKQLLRDKEVKRAYDKMKSQQALIESSKITVSLK